MICFMWMAKSFICFTLHSTLDQLQFVYCANGSTSNTPALHMSHSHLEGKNMYLRMLLTDLSSTLNIIFPTTLITMSLDRHLDFLKGRPQMDSTGSLTVSYLTLFTGAPQGCMLSHLLYSTANIYHHRRPYHRCWRNGLQEAAHSPGCWEPKQPLLFLVAASLPDSAAVPLETAGTYIEWWSAELIGSRKLASQTGCLPEKSQVRWSSAKHLLCTLPTHIYAYFVFIFFFFSLCSQYFLYEFAHWYILFRSNVIFCLPSIYLAIKYKETPQEFHCRILHVLTL